jgi:predicted metal-dependent HD superfamily phosphohydrolase
MQFRDEEEQAILERSGLLDEYPIDTLKVVHRYYDEPARCYHDWQHALSVISWTNHVCDVFSAKDLEPYKPIDLARAALFHDVIYAADQGSPKNEEQSVEVFRDLSRGPDDGFQKMVDIDGMARVASLIMATAEHGKHKREADYSLAVRLFLDCDLAFFLADPRYEVFTEFNRRVEVEYLKVYEPEQVYAGRRKFLQGMVDHDHIFLTDYFRSRFELQAKANLRRLLSETPSPTVSTASH